MKIFYVGFYDVLERNKGFRAVPLPGRNKMDYIITVLEKICEHITIVSPCSAQRGYCGSENISLSNKSNLVLFKSIGNRSVLGRALNRTLISIQLFFFLLSNIKPGDILISYHSLATMRVIYLIHKIKKVRIIYEFEELYADVIKKPSIREKEKKIARSMDAFLFPTILLNDAINIYNKPYVLIHGNYNYEKRIVNHDNNIIKCVFAGNLEPRKGAIEAIQAAAFLPANYSLNIIGFGSAEQIKKIQELSKAITETGECKVVFDGLKKGAEYLKYIQSCDIGLCTQDPNAEFTSTSFPSKILSYMSNGLRVVSVRIPAIEQSSIAPYISFCDDVTPRQIANAIQAINIDEQSSSENVLKNLSDQFCTDMKKLLWIDYD